MQFTFWQRFLIEIHLFKYISFLIVLNCIYKLLYNRVHKKIAQKNCENCNEIQDSKYKYTIKIVLLLVNFIFCIKKEKSSLKVQNYMITDFFSQTNFLCLKLIKGN